MMETKPIDTDLLDILERMMDDLADPDCHYTVFANYYDHLTQGREGQRRYITHIWFNQDTAQHIQLREDGLVCDVHLNRHDLSQIHRILIPYDQIWNVQLVKGAAGFDPKLYHRREKLNLKRPSDVD